jgi:hypothetical protein
VTKPFSSAVGLSTPFRPPGFVERSVKVVSNASDAPPSREDKNLEKNPVTTPLPATPSEDVESHHQEGKGSNE